MTYPHKALYENQAFATLPKPITYLIS